MEQFITNGRSYVAPTFHRLINLLLDPVGSCGWGMLNLFIECSPKLEVVDINKRCRIVESWSPPPRVPDCLQSCLKDIFIEGFDGDEYELKAIAYLLKNAKTLKEMTIDCTGVRKEDYIVCEKLSQFPKASTHCQLDLFSFEVDAWEKRRGDPLVKGVDTATVRRTDRMSSLHDSILCHNLSFLPTKLVVGTSVLSNSHPSIPTLDFDDFLTFQK